MDGLLEAGASPFQGAQKKRQREYAQTVLKAMMQLGMIDGDNEMPRIALPPTPFSKVKRKRTW